MKKLVVLAFILAGCDKGLTVRGWKDGVVLCKAKAIVINVGHQDDPQVKELLNLARTCK